MPITPAAVQAELDAAVADLEKTTASYPAMVKAHGSDWTKWPTTTSWYRAFSAIRTARAEAGDLTTKVLTAAFKES